MTVILESHTLMNLYEFTGNVTLIIVFRVQDAQIQTESQPSGTLANEVRS